MQLLLHAVVSIMGRGSRSRFKYYMPEIPVEQFDIYGITMPAAGPFAEKFEYIPPTVDDNLLTEAEFEDKFKVDEASKLQSYSADITLVPTEHFVGVDTNASAITITLPTAASISSGKQLVIKDEGGSAGTNSITITTYDGSLIDGETSVKLESDYAAINIYYNGSGWHIY